MKFFLFLLISTALISQGHAESNLSQRQEQRKADVECAIFLRYMGFGLPLLSSHRGTGRTEEIAINNAIEDCKKDEMYGDQCKPENITVDACAEGGLHYVVPEVPGSGLY